MRGVLCFALFCTPSPEPRAAPVLTRWSGEPVLLRGRGARAAGTRRRGGPRARGATTSSSPSGCGRGPKELEKEPGEGEKRSSISSSSTPPKRPSSRDPGGPPDPRALAQPLRPPRLCASPKASPKPAGARRLSSCSRPRALPRRPRQTGEPGTAHRHDRLSGPQPWCVTLAAPRRPQLLAPLGLHLRPPRRPRPNSCPSTLPGRLGRPRISGRSASLARRPCSPAPSRGTRSPGRRAPGFP